MLFADFGSPSLLTLGLEPWFCKFNPGENNKMMKIQKQKQKIIIIKNKKKKIEKIG